MAKLNANAVSGTNPEINKIFDLLKLDEAGMAKAIEEMFEAAARDPRKREALEHFVTAIKNPRTRAAINWSIRWGLAMEQSRAARAIAQSKKGQEN
jgi:hypothetical protein